MGVLELFSTLVRTDITSNSVSINFRQKIRVEHFLLDFNSIIHVSSQVVLDEVNTFFKLIMKNIFNSRPMNSNVMIEYFRKYKMEEFPVKIKSNEAIERFNNHFTSKYLDKMVITRVIKTVINIVNTYCDDKYLKTIYLSIDGVPSKGKMIEQRQRRYVGALSEKYEKKILESYKNYLINQPDNIWVAESYSVNWSRNKITPGTAFMHKLCAYLKSPKIQAKIKGNKPNAEVILSDMYEVGEGEKKIMNYAHKNIIEEGNVNDSVLVYSPDADVVLLCMILPIKAVHILRHSQQDNWYDLINVQTLKSNIAYYVNNHPSYSKSKFDTDRIIYDIVYLSSIFGNDFVPKIETISVKSDFTNIMEAYLNTLIESKPNYLVNVPDQKGGKIKSKSDSNSKSYPKSKSKSRKKDLNLNLNLKGSGNRFTLNLEFMKKVFQLLLPLENDYVKNNDLFNKYIRARVIKNTFPTLNIDIDNVESVVKDFRADYENFCHLIRNNQRLSDYADNDEFMSSIKKCIRLERDGQQVNVAYMSNQEVVSLMKKHIKEVRKSPKLSINLDVFSKSLEDRYHIEQIKKKEKKTGRPVNAYEKEIYRFRNMLDHYQTKFNAQKMDLSEGGVKTYYKRYFDLDVDSGHKQKNQITELDSIVRDYLEGLTWVFEYYFNDRTYINTWYYKHEKAPLLRHISNYISKASDSLIEDITEDIPSYIVKSPKDFFNPIEQLIYVSPMTPSITKLLPSNYVAYMKTDEFESFKNKYFVDVEKIVERVWKENICSDIDCRGQPYLTKCILSKVHRPSSSTDKKFLNLMHNVAQNDISKKRSKCRFPQY